MSSIHDKDNHLFTISDLLDWKPPQYTRIISSGVLNTKNKMLIFGDEGSWKSILAVHTAHCIARGSRWLGFYTYPSNVIRIQVELPMYIDRGRTEKYCIASKQIYIAKYTKPGETPTELEAKATAYAYPTRYVSRTEQYFHIDESLGWESLLKNIRLCIAEFPPAPIVVIIDPLYKVFGRNLNEGTDVMPLLDKIDIAMEDMENTVGLSFIIVHHTRKSITDDSGNIIALGSQDSTGWRGITRWADTVLRIDPDPRDKTLTRVEATFTKHRNAEDVLPITRLRWNRDTLHPQILQQIMPKYEDAEELEIRGKVDIAQLE